MILNGFNTMNAIVYWCNLFLVLRNQHNPIIDLTAYNFGTEYFAHPNVASHVLISYSLLLFIFRLQEIFVREDESAKEKQD